MKKNILDYLTSTVKSHPAKTAIIEGEKTISFKNLDKKAKILAKILISKRDIRNEPIAVFLPKTIDSVIADIAITYSSNIYMNLDIKTPKERIKNIVELVKPKFIITNTLYLKFISEIGKNDIIVNIDTINFDASSNVMSKNIKSSFGNINKNPLVGLGVVGTKTLIKFLFVFSLISPVFSLVANPTAQTSFLGYCTSTTLLLLLPLSLKD